MVPPVPLLTTLKIRSLLEMACALTARLLAGFAPLHTGLLSARRSACPGKCGPVCCGGTQETDEAHVQHTVRVADTGCQSPHR